MRETVIVSAARTPIGRFGGALKDLSAVDLGGIAIKAAVERAGIDPAGIDFVVMGQVLQAACGQIPSRQATFKAGLPKEIPSETLNKVCASSFRAVTLADQVIRSGDADIVVAGGMESMSNAPYAARGMRWGERMFNTEMLDLMVHDGLWCAAYDRHMAVHGGVVAREYGVSRQEQDEWALRSQTLAVKAVTEGRLKEEITPVTLKSKKGERIFDADETPRPETTLESLAKLPALFTPDNTVTAGNAPATNDAGAALMLMSRERAEKLGLAPIATIVGSAAVSEYDAAYIATAPGHAIQKLLQKTGLAISDVDLLEVNEAFAAVPLVSNKIAAWDQDLCNVNGGAVAFGHPIGASGARIIMTLAFEMRRRGARYGIAAICSGGAQGDALLLRYDR